MNNKIHKMHKMYKIDKMPPMDSMRQIRVVVNGKEVEVTDKGIKKEKLDRYMNSTQINELIEQKRKTN